MHTSSDMRTNTEPQELKKKKKQVSHTAHTNREEKTKFDETHDILIRERK